MNFRSDNTAPVAPEIMTALSRANEGAASAYGADDWSCKLDDAFGALFERDVRVFPVISGTAANALALASTVPPWGAVLCHREAHIERDECGAVEFYSGARMRLLDGADAKIDAEAVRLALADNDGSVHQAKLMAVSISQSTERGTLYRPQEVASLSTAAKRAGLTFHVDGARFANAIAALRCSPADLTWRAGVDVLSFGATKNGAMAAEAIVVFDGERAEEIERRRKRAGHLVSKGRYVATQLLAYVEGGLWLRLAGRANMLAARIAEVAAPLLSAPAETNQIFIKVGAAGFAQLKAAGVEFYEWGPQGSGEARLVVSWDQSESDVERLCGILRSLA